MDQLRIEHSPLTVKMGPPFMMYTIIMFTYVIKGKATKSPNLDPSDICPDSSCLGRCDEGPRYKYDCACDTLCLQFKDCCYDFESQCPIYVQEKCIFSPNQQTLAL